MIKNSLVDTFTGPILSNDPNNSNLSPENFRRKRKDKNLFSSLSLFSALLYTDKVNTSTHNNQSLYTLKYGRRERR